MKKTLDFFVFLEEMMSSAGRFFVFMEGVIGLEQLVLLSIKRQEPYAYGVSIKKQLYEATQRDYSVGTIYSVLDRLSQSGLIKSRGGPAEEKRGGRAKLFYDLTPAGIYNLRVSLQNIDRLREGFDLGKVPA